jgi:hypothetical protein
MAVRVSSSTLFLLVMIMAFSATPVAFLLLLVSYAASSGLPCKDQSGNAVDWWVIMKLPYMPGNANTIAASGYAYAYSDPKGSLTLTTHGEGAFSFSLQIS